MKKLRVLQEREPSPQEMMFIVMFIVYFYTILQVMFILGFDERKFVTDT